MRRRRFARCLSLACVFALLGLAGVAYSQHGKFDKTPLNPADEAYIFTPPGFTVPGKPAKAAGEAVGKLQVTVTDTATGKPTFCRVNVVGADGNFYEPADNPLAAHSLTGTWPERLAGNRPSKAPIRYFGHFFYTNGQFTVDVPAGAARVEVWKGLEYRPAVVATEVQAGQTAPVNVAITRTAPMAARGWYSGDLHLHFDRTSDTDEKLIYDLLEAEDVRMGLVLCYNENTSAYPGAMKEMVAPQERGLGLASASRRGETQILSAQEYRNGLFGHLNLYLRDRLALDGQRLDPNVGPVFGAIGAETQAHGGYAFHAHGGYALEIWADLVQGATNGVELMQFGIYRGIGLDGWYHVLNAGFRFPGMAASDYPACRKLADCRTYVYQPGEPNFKDWMRGAAEGRSFMTTGPLLLLDVDDHRPGDTITTADDKPRTVKMHLRVESETAPVTNIQIVVNGQVVRARRVAAPRGESQQIDVVESLELTESSWIAARAFSVAPSGSPDAESHTNPVYVHLNGRAPFRQADLDWLVERLDEQIADHEARTVPEKATPIEYFRRSRELLLARRARGGQPLPKAESNAAAAQPGASDAQLAEFLKSVPAKSPPEAEKAFETVDGFRMELVAHEPEVVDPVAACFDENGGMYVAEMIDYPYRPKEGQKPLGRVRYLQDADGDGRYERSWVFADEIVWPTGIACWKGGVYVAAAPDIWYLKDNDGDHVADVREKAFTGFGDRNQQGGVNNLYWGIDHAIYGSGSSNGGSIRRAGDDDQPPIVLSGRDFRFDPVNDKFETVTGSRQFGNAFDNTFNRFLCSESKPAYHVVLPQHYLARNPWLAVPTAINDLAPGVTPIFRTSPVERWREIRSNRRLAAGERSPNSAGLSHNVIDAGAGLAIYRGHAYPPEFIGDLFIGCSQNNLIHHRKLTSEGATFRSARVEAGTEFVRTTDTWFRPVNCIHAPDGTLYVLDMSREVIESIHIANDVVAHLDLTNGRDKGRIYRLAPPGFKVPPQPKLGAATTAELVATLEHPGGWWRDTAARLLYERQDRAAVEPLRKLARESRSELARMHALWALAGLKSLTDDDLLPALSYTSPVVREHAVRLAEPRLGKTLALLDRVLELSRDDSPRVRFQVAFTLGETPDARAVDALAAIAQQDIGDRWTQAAVLSSCAERADRLLVALCSCNQFVARTEALSWLEPLSLIVGARNRREEIERVLSATATQAPGSSAQWSIVLGLGDGLQRASASLASVELPPDSPVAKALSQLMQLADEQANDHGAPLAERLRAVRLLGYAGNENLTGRLIALLGAREPEDLQLAVLRIVGRGSDAALAQSLIAAWRGTTPKVQEEIIASLVGRASWIPPLLDACERGEVAPAQVTRTSRAALVSHQDAAIRQRAEKLFGAASAARAEVVARYQSALQLAGDRARGEKLYERECSACHRLGERGNQVGPNLALVRNRTPAALIDAILDPNREVQPNYVNYVVVDDSGRTFTGLITSETAGSITLARDKGVSETILKQNIELVRSTGKSLMPEDLEKAIDPQAMADLLAFLEQVRYDIGTLPDFATPQQ